MSDNYEFNLVEKIGPILKVTMNRPERRNALHPPANNELERIFNDFASDDDLHVAILTGAGNKSFSAGNDLKYQAAGNPLTIPETGFAGLTSRFDLDKPVIGAINGVSLGGGFEIALACDLIIATESALFGLPEPKVGLAALAGGLHRLPRELGMKKAMELILTGKSITAREGAELGFVNAVVPESELQTTAMAWAEQITACSPVSIRASKRIIREGLAHADLKGAMSSGVETVQWLINSEDAKEGVAAFAEKRKPQWRGR